MFDYERFRRNMIIKRKILNLTQQALANEIDVCEKTISRIERTYQNPSLAVIIGILNYFNCTIKQFMEEDECSEKQVLVDKINETIINSLEEEKIILFKVIQNYNEGNYDTY